ncbi:MAG: SPOR domain-containing protein [Magnetococcales bacterium]|nr:SPOR domain-containing protein [Magnetococcales bacterium]
MDNSPRFPTESRYRRHQNSGYFSQALLSAAILAAGFWAWRSYQGDGVEAAPKGAVEKVAGFQERTVIREGLAPREVRLPGTVQSHNERSASGRSQPAAEEPAVSLPSDGPITVALAPVLVAPGAAVTAPAAKAREPKPEPEKPIMTLNFYEALKDQQVVLPEVTERPPQTAWTAPRPSVPVQPFRVPGEPDFAARGRSGEGSAALATARPPVMPPRDGLGATAVVRPMPPREGVGTLVVARTPILPREAVAGPLTAVRPTVAPVASRQPDPAPSHAQPAVQPLAAPVPNNPVVAARNPTPPVPPAGARSGPADMGGGNFMVTLADYQDFNKAANVTSRLQRQGAPAQVMRIAGVSGSVYRVGLGPFSSQDAASEAARRWHASL